MYRNRCFPQASTLLSLPEQHRKGRRGTGEGLVPKKDFSSVPRSMVGKSWRSMVTLGYSR